MAISLSKNQAISLEMEAGAGLKKVSIRSNLTCNAPLVVCL